MNTKLLMTGKENALCLPEVFGTMPSPREGNFRETSLLEITEMGLDFIMNIA